VRSYQQRLAIRNNCECQVRGTERREGVRGREREREKCSKSRAPAPFIPVIYMAPRHIPWLNDRPVTARGGGCSLFRVLSRLDSLSCGNSAFESDENDGVKIISL